MRATSSATLPAPTTTARSTRGRTRAPGSRGGRCTRRRTRSRSTSRAGPRRGSRVRRGLRADRVHDGVVGASRSACSTSRPTSTLPKNRKPGRWAMRSKARETSFSFGWSGATPSRTRPQASGAARAGPPPPAGRRGRGRRGAEAGRAGADDGDTEGAIVRRMLRADRSGRGRADRGRTRSREPTGRHSEIEVNGRSPARPGLGALVVAGAPRRGRLAWWDSRLPDTYNVMDYGYGRLRRRPVPRPPGRPRHVGTRPRDRDDERRLSPRAERADPTRASRSPRACDGPAALGPRVDALTFDGTVRAPSCAFARATSSRSRS